MTENIQVLAKGSGPKALISCWGECKSVQSLRKLYESL